jgi:hypothetical protein
MPRELACVNGVQIEVLASGLIDGTIIAIALAGKGNNSIK